MLPVGTNFFKLLRGGSPQKGTALYRGSNKGGGLQSGDLPGEIFLGAGLIHFDIQSLTAADTVGAYGLRKEPGASESSFRGNLESRKTIEQKVHGPDEKRPPRKNRHALTEDHVVRGLSSAYCIIIHAGKVIMNQRSRMKHLQSEPHEKQRLPGGSEELSSRHAKGGTQPLPPRKEGIYHGIVELRRNAPRKAGKLPGTVGFEIHPGLFKKRRRSGMLFSRLNHGDPPLSPPPRFSLPQRG